MSDLMPIKDLAGLSKPLTKLIETVSNAIGTLYEPARIRRKAKAEAEGAIINAKSKAEVDEIEFLASERIQYLELRRQMNIEKISDIARDQLPEIVSDEKVDDDWTVQFFNYSQDIGNDEMQQIWGKLLAGEIAQPGTFSLHTLSVLKILRRDDALLFKRLCSYVWGKRYIINFYHMYKTFFQPRDYDWSSILQLETLGLLNQNVGWTKKPNEVISINYFGDNYHFTNEKAYDNRLEGLALSRAGEELFLLCDRTPDYDYLNEVINFYSNENSPFSIKKNEN